MRSEPVFMVLLATMARLLCAGQVADFRNRLEREPVNSVVGLQGFRQDGRGYLVLLEEDTSAILPPSFVFRLRAALIEEARAILPDWYDDIWRGSLASRVAHGLTYALCMLILTLSSSILLSAIAVISMLLVHQLLKIIQYST
jgi:hypothetical protein